MALRPIPLPGTIPIDGAITSGISLGTEEIRRLIQSRRRQRVLSLEEKRALNKELITPNTATFQRDEQSINIFIVDLDSTNESEDLELDRIQLQNIPRNIIVEPDANWVNISPIARNNPFYHYTGGEDTIKLTLDWYSDKKDGGALDELRTEALRKAKWLEAKTRNDGLEKPPHRVKLLCGGESSEQDPDKQLFLAPMFNEATFIVHNAPYTMSGFHKAQGLRPTQIIQELTLKRITEGNRTANDVLRLSS